MNVDQRAPRAEQAVRLLDGGNHVISFHAAERPREDRNVEHRRGGLGREVRERDTAQRNAARQLLRQVLFRTGDGGRKRFDGRYVFRLLRGAPGQTTVAATNLKDAASIELNEAEERTRLVLLRVDPDHHRSIVVCARSVTPDSP